MPGHAYTLLGCYELKDGSGRTVERLLHMRNPWANEKYTGPWNDSDPRWTSAYKQQVPYERGNEGKFFISLRDFQQAFPVATVSYVYDDYSYSYF